MLKLGSVEHPDRALVVWELQLQFSPHAPIESRTALSSHLPSNRFLQGQDCLPGTVLIFQFVDRDPCSFARGTIQYPDNSELSLTLPIFDVDQISAAKLSFDPGQKGPASAQVRRQHAFRKPFTARIRARQPDTHLNPNSLFGSPLDHSIQPSLLLRQICRLVEPTKLGQKLNLGPATRENSSAGTFSELPSPSPGIF